MPPAMEAKIRIIEYRAPRGSLVCDERGRTGYEPWKTRITASSYQRPPGHRGAAPGGKTRGPIQCRQRHADNCGWRSDVAGVRNLRQTEAIERARLLDVAAYDISLDLSNAGSADTRTFRSVTQVRFTCAEPGASTFIELAADSLRSATLNGEPLDLSGWTVENGLPLTGLAAENTLLVNADCLYSTTGQGMHRSADPSDGQTYLYSQFETNDAQRVFACFDQPDLKAEFTFTVAVPSGWLAISNMPVAERTAGVGTTTFRFEKAPKMSTYITAVCAGPYHEVREVHDGIDLGVYCRQSMKQYFDADDLLLITKQGFDFFHEKFEIRYPFESTTRCSPRVQRWGDGERRLRHVPRTDYIFRSPVTDCASTSTAPTRSCTRWRTCGSATSSPCAGGTTCGSTSRSRNGQATGAVSTRPGSPTHGRPSSRSAKRGGIDRISCPPLIPSTARCPT